MSTNSIPAVLHLVDTLDLGGTERVAVNLANHTPRGRYRAYLCSARRAGPLASTLREGVPHFNLKRRFRFDLAAVTRLRRFIRQENIQLLHVHASSLFLGRLVSLLSDPGRVHVIWHDHYGRCEWNDRPTQLYRLAVMGAAGVIAVNHRLVDWARQELRVPAQRVWYVPNFVLPVEAKAKPLQELPGSEGSRIVCVANLRPQKDHLTLIRAMAVVCRKHPEAHLLLIGAAIDEPYARSLHQTVIDRHLEKNITFLGQLREAATVLPACDVGVLSSASEGLPLSLLEYGWAGIPAIATSVGQCPEVLDHGRAGILVEPASPEPLAAAIQFLLDSVEQRRESGRRLRQFVRKTFDPGAVMEQICRIYALVLSEGVR